MDNDITTVDDLNNAKGLRLLHMNVRSLSKKMDQIRLLFHGSDLDVITISETWLSDAVSWKTIALDGYTLSRQDRDFKAVSKKRGGGLLTYIRGDHAADCEFLEDYGRSDGNIEAQWSIIYRPHCKDVVICNIYRPPTGSLEKAIVYIDDILQLFNLNKVEVYIMGDMNVNYKNKSSKDFKKLNFFIKANGFTQVIENTTRNTDKTKSLLDIVLTNSKYIERAGTLDHFISDHQPIFVIKKKKRDRRPKVEFKGRSYRNYKKDVLERKLLEQNWDQFYKFNDPEVAWAYILGRLTPILDQMCPIRTFSIKNYRPEWVTDELIEQVKDRDYFYKQAKLSGEVDSWNIARHLRNLTNTNIRRARKEFVLFELRENSNDYKRFWKTIRSVIPDNKGTNKQNILLSHNGDKIPKQDVAHFVNTYFTNIGNFPGNSPLNPSMSQESGEDMSDETEGSDDGMWNFSEIRQSDVLKVVKSINTSKSSGIENVSSFILKETFTILLAQITHLFNLTTRTCVFPKAWKEALVIPIPKTGNLTKVQNYRPISLLPLPGKLLEKLIHTQVSAHLENIKFLSDNQHGFRKHHSTVHSIAQLTNYINAKMDKGLPTLAAFIDFRKAFDCVQHQILLGKLSTIGIDKRAIRWFESYLTDRKQRVLANNTYSTFQSVTQGVPQGSVLGPLFYIIYANDINKIIKSCKVALYADDTVLYTASANFNRSVGKIQSDMNALSQWCNLNGIRMNTEKTKLMVFGNTTKVKKLPTFEVQVNGEPLIMTNCYKYLGVALDGQLNYNLHVQNIIARVSLKLRQFKRMRYFLDVRAATLVYKNMILPIMEYGDIFLVGATVENKKKLQVLQNKGLRCAFMRDHETSVEELHRLAKLQKLKVRRDQHLLSYMFDQACTGKHLKKRRLTGVKTRSQNKKLLHLCKPNTEKFKKSLAYRGPRRWNSLPDQYHHCKTRSQFINRVKVMSRPKLAKLVKKS